LQTSGWASNFLFEDACVVAAGGAKPMGPAAQDRSRRTGKRTMGAATAGKRNYIDRNESRFGAGGLDNPRTTVITDSPRCG